MDKLVLIDGNSLVNRAFFATPVFTNKEGLPTNGIFGFIKLVLKIINDKKPDYFAVAFDVHAPTFRHEQYKDYKAGRNPMPAELVAQMPVLKEVLKLMNIKIVELKGFEADDVIGTLSKRFKVKTFIYTGDRDSYQLVDDTTNVCFTRKGVSDILELSSENFKSEIDLIPSQIIDLKALMGDKSDNIPGVAGVGEKTANNLLHQYNDLDGVYAHLDEIKGALNKKLTDNKETAYFSKYLATICTNVPLDINLSDCVLKMPFSSDVKKKFIELEFKSLISLPIFEDESKDNSQEEQLIQKDSVNLDSLECENLQDVISYYDNFKGDSISVYLDKELLQVYFIDDNNKEFNIKIKTNLLDTGFYFDDIKDLLNKIFNGNSKVILFNSKEIRHELYNDGISFNAEFEDVSLIKYISDATGTAETLSFSLDYNNLSQEHKAFGIAELYKIYKSRLSEDEVSLYYSIELPLSIVLFDMETEGVCIDNEMLEDISIKYNNELKSLTEEIYEMAGEEFNINSPAQLGRILFEKLNIGLGKVKKSKGKKNYSTTAETLEKFAGENEIISKILRYKQIQKLNSTYIDGFRPLINNGKIHTTYIQNNTTTGRLSSANPNLQNIPVRNDEGKELRKLFKASEGNVLIDADYSQIELRLLAHFSKSKELVDAYNNKSDIHSLTASQVFQVPLNKVTPEMRRSAKAVNFGIIYGISPFGLGQDLGISTQKAKNYIDKYFELYSNVKEYMDSNVVKAKEDGYITTLFGRRRIINELSSSNFNVRAFGERAAMNMPLQGSSADIIKIAMINVHKKLKEIKSKAKLVIQVHDELIIDCPVEEKENVAQILKSEMENCVKLLIPLVADVAIGKNWFEAK